MAMAQPAEPATEAFERALAEERLRSTRQLSAFRFQGVSAFLALMILFHLTVTGWVSPPLGLFAGYWVAAGVVWWTSRRSERLARLSGFSIPMIDMPFVLLLLRGAIAALQERGLHTEALASHAPLYYVSLVVLASFALENRQGLGHADLGAREEAPRRGIARGRDLVRRNCAADERIVEPLGMELYGLRVHQRERRHQVGTALGHAPDEALRRHRVEEAAMHDGAGAHVEGHVLVILALRVDVDRKTTAPCGADDRSADGGRVDRPHGA